MYRVDEETTFCEHGYPDFEDCPECDGCQNCGQTWACRCEDDEED